MAQQVLMLMVGAAVGALMGTFYFGGLWLTLRRARDTRRPAMWLGLSLLARTLVVAGVFYLLATTSWSQLGAALLGLLAARGFLLRRLPPAISHPPSCDLWR